MRENLQLRDCEQKLYRAVLEKVKQGTLLTVHIFLVEGGCAMIVMRKYRAVSTGARTLLLIKDYLLYVVSSAQCYDCQHSSVVA